MGLSIKDRLLDSRVVKQYINMIKSDNIETVKQLRDNIESQAKDHPVYKNTLQPEFIKRLGE